MSEFKKIKLSTEIIKENKILFDNLLQLTVSDLVSLKKINLKSIKDINREIDFKIYDESLDEIDKIEIKKSIEKFNIERVLIEAAIREKYYSIFHI